MQWYRQYAEFATDPKVQMMPEVMQRRLVMLFCIRCNGNETFHETEIPFQLRITEVEWHETKKIFIERGFIDKTNKILNWDKRQYISDSSTERVKRFRKRHETVTVTPSDTDSEADTEQKQKRKNPPTPQGKGFNGSGFDVLKMVGEKTLQLAKKNAPGWDIYFLAGVYNQSVNERGQPNNVNLAFPAWCAKYTKGKAL